MRVLLLAAVVLAKQKYEECHLYRSAVIAREREPSRRRLLPRSARRSAGRRGPRTPF